MLSIELPLSADAVQAAGQSREKRTRLLCSSRLVKEVDGNANALLVMGQF